MKDKNVKSQKKTQSDKKNDKVKQMRNTNYSPPETRSKSKVKQSNKTDEPVKKSNNRDSFYSVNDWMEVYTGDQFAVNQRRNHLVNGLNNVIKAAKKFKGTYVKTSDYPDGTRLFGRRIILTKKAY